MSRIVVATRKSALALAQCRAWIGELERQHPSLEVEELQVTTTGDRVLDRPLSEIGGKGLFVKEIEEALLDGRADIAVHSMKDVPPELAPSLTIGCVSLREDPRDVIVTRTGAVFEALAPGSRVGTSSLRRRAQLAAWRPDLEIVPLRGNVDTRLRKCVAGEVDAVVLARAGLVRLGLLDRVTETLEPERSLPAVGQGALCVEQRAGDERVAALLAALNHDDTARAVAAERGVMHAVGGDCKTPVAALGIRDEDCLWLRAMLADADCSGIRRRELRVPWPNSEAEARALGYELGRTLLPTSSV
jgi:hydroxymethylbilane synthase